MKKRKKLEIYIHIPFCVRKCNYCDFLSFSAKEELQEQYTAALEKEINCFFSSDDFLQGNYKISSVFIGGGTPSLLKAEHITRLLARRDYNRSQSRNAGRKKAVRVPESRD